MDTLINTIKRVIYSLEVEADLINNESYLAIKDCLGKLYTLEHKTLNKKEALNKKEILDSIATYLIQNKNKPSAVSEFVVHLKEKNIISGNENPGIVIGAFLRSDDRFNNIKNDRVSQWILQDVIEK